MNTATIRTAVLDGLRARPAELRIERESARGPFELEISGLGRTATETVVRVRTELERTGMILPAGRFAVHATPATKRNTGMHDLPVALGVLAAAGRIDAARLKTTLIVGGIDTHGTLTHVNGMFPVANLCRQLARELIGATAHQAEAAWAGPVNALLRDELDAIIQAVRHGEQADTLRPEDANHHHEPTRQEPIPGYLDAKRALEIAVAGGHPLLVSSEPGTPIGQLVQRTAQWAGPLRTDEWKVLTTARSIAGMLGPHEAGALERPFRAPHCTASRRSIAGTANGGNDATHRETVTPARLGEATLAHGGILYLEEADRFLADAITPLRAAARTGTVTDQTGELPADTLLIGNVRTGIQANHPLQGTFQAAIAVPRERQADEHERQARIEEEKEAEGWRRMRIEFARNAQQRRYGGTTTNARADLDTLLTSGNPTPEAQQRITQMESGLGRERTTNTVRLALTMADLQGTRRISDTDLLAAERLVHHAC